MATCPASCTGSCPEIVPVTIYQTVLQLDSTDVTHGRLYKLGSDFTNNGDGTSHFDLTYAPLINKQLMVFLNGKAQGEDSSGAQFNFSLSGTVLTLQFVPDAADNIQIDYWYATP